MASLGQVDDPGQVYNPGVTRQDRNLSLPPGTSLGPYEVLGAIGAGGMGEVYRARDTRLGREVALKVLSESLAGDADHVVRFDREARALAALNHPFIAHLYRFEQSGATHAIVMELVAGETSRSGSHMDRCRSPRRWAWPGRSPRRSKQRTSRGSSIAI